MDKDGLLEVTHACVLHNVERSSLHTIYDIDVVSGKSPEVCEGRGMWDR